MPISGIPYIEDEFNGTGRLQDRTFTSNGVTYRWVDGYPANPDYKDMFLTGTGEVGQESEGDVSAGYVLTVESTGLPVALTKPYVIELAVDTVENGKVGIGVGDYNYSLFTIKNAQARLGYASEPINAQAYPQGSFPGNPTISYGAHTLTFEREDAGFVRYRVDGTQLGYYDHYTPYNPAHLIIFVWSGSTISSVRIYLDEAVTPPPDLPPLIYEEWFNYYDLSSIYEGTLENSCIGTNTATFERAPTPFDNSFVTNRTDPSVFRGAAAFEAATAGSGDRFYVPFNQIDRPITAEDVCAQVLVSVSGPADTVTFGWLDASNKKTIAAGIRLTVEAGVVVIETFYYQGGVRYSDVQTTGGETTPIYGQKPGDFWLRCARRPYVGPNTTFSTDMSLRGGGATVGGIGELVTDLYVNEPVVEITGDARLHYIYVGTDYPEFTADAALLGDGRFWASLVNANEEV